LESRFDTPEPYLVTASQSLGLLRHKLLLVDEGEVGAVEILDEETLALNHNPGVLTGNTTLIPAIISEINIGENTTDRIFSPNDNLALSGRKRQRCI
jgi:hypothetical protein